MNREGQAVPPYGPSSGMLQALELLRRTTPPKVDSDFLRAHRIAPGNEYKVVGALRFLGIIDEDDRPTERSQHLKTRGATYTLALQGLVHDAYRGLFQSLEGQPFSRDHIYNYFVTQAGLGAEMATKASRFFIKLCRLAELDLGPELASASAGERKRGRPRGRPRRSKRDALSLGEAGPPPLVLALTPELADMDQERLTQLFRKVRVALHDSLADKGK